MSTCLFICQLLLWTVCPCYITYSTLQERMQHFLVEVDIKKSMEKNMFMHVVRTKTCFIFYFHTLKVCFYCKIKPSVKIVFFLILTFIKYCLFRKKRYIYSFLLCALLSHSLSRSWSYIIA